MRITFVISSLGFGGAERVRVTMANYWMANYWMANYWAGKGWPVTLITLDDAGPAYAPAPEVQRVGLGVMAPCRPVLKDLPTFCAKPWPAACRQWLSIVLSARGR